MQENIELTVSIVTIIGFPLAILSIFFAGISLRNSKKVEEGKFLIELRKMFSEHNFVHYKLRNGGVWTTEDNPIPDHTKNWAKIDSYLGLFELCEILIKNGSLTEKHFSRQYKYRLENILENDQIVLKIKDERDYWSDLLKLIYRVNLKKDL